MKTSLDLFRRRPMFHLWLAILALATGLPSARAGLTVEIHLYNNNNFYFAYGFLSANATPPDFPIGTYFISSPQPAAAGTTVQYQSGDGATLNYIGGGGTGVGDFPSLMQVITNGDWTILVTNATSTNTYAFTVSAPDLPADLLAETTVTSPGAGVTDVSQQPTFTWTGPLAWEGALNVRDYTNDASGNGYGVVSASLPPAQTSWLAPSALPVGTNTFGISYTSNATAFIVASTPTNSSDSALPGWVSTAVLETYTGSEFSVGAPYAAGGPQGHFLVAHYPFDNGDISGTDTSGNGNNFNGNASSWGSGLFQSFTTDAVAGGGALQFYGFSSLAAYYTDPGNLFSNLVSTLAGSFSVSGWLNTSSLMGNDDDSAQNGSIVVYAFNADSQADGVIPLAVTGSKLAFYTGDAAGVGSTLHSATSVVNNSDQYVHVVVTRNQATGQKLIYINGALDASETGSQDSLAGDTNYFSIGGVLGDSYTGLLDDLQVYSGVLTSNEVASLFLNPGTTTANDTLSGLVAYYDFNEGAATAPDVSGNGNNLVLAGSFGGGNGPVISSQSIAGAGSVSFDGGSYLSAPPALLPVLAGTFSISLWVNTGQNAGSPENNGFIGGGAGIIAADVPGVTEDLVPVALTGGLIGFNTGGTSDNTLYSATLVNDNNWHHVVVTRDQPSGLKQIFIDGSLDSSETDTTDLLAAPQLLVFGCLADAGNPDPASPGYTGGGGYVGLLDDVQIYDRVLASSEVLYLDSNPGLALTNINTQVAFSPASVDLTLTIGRTEDPVNGEYYILFPGLGAVSPALLTTNSLSSPNGLFNAYQTTSSGGSGSLEMSTLADVLNECTNGQWQLYINQGDPSQQLFTFSVTNIGVTTGLLTPAAIVAPADGAVNVSTTPAFSWTGPADFSSVFVNVFLPGGANEGNTTLPGTATAWPSPPVLNYGTNRFEVTFSTNDTSLMAFSVPTNQVGTPMAGFTTHTDLASFTFSVFLVGEPIAPAQLINVQPVAGATHFQFLSQVGVTGSIQSRTNLALGNWVPCADIPGDGTMKTVTIPATNGPTEFFRILSHY